MLLIFCLTVGICACGGDKYRNGKDDANITAESFGKDTYREDSDGQHISQESGQFRESNEVSFPEVPVDD